MNFVDYVVIGIIVLILGGVGWYLHRAKKKGVKCVGCPDSKTCSGNCAGCSGACQKDRT
jgi:hypothetical protein